MADAASVLSSLRAAHTASSKGALALSLGKPREAEAPLSPGQTELPPELREALLLPGACVELVGAPGRGAMSLALQCMAEALATQLSSSSLASMATSRSWLAAIDPTRVLFAPAVRAMGLPLERLVVVAPPSSSMLRVAVRVMKSGVFCAAVVDATTLTSLTQALVSVRRLTLAAEATASTVFFLTDERSERQAQLPAAVRARVYDGGVVVERHRFGAQATSVAEGREFAWEPPRSPLQRFWGNE
jgi:hypothetical protein